MADEDVHLKLDAVKQAREALGLTQQQAGEAAGFKNGRQSWNHIESGRQATITLATLWKLAKVLKVEARDLLKPGPPIEVEKGKVERRNSLKPAPPNRR